MLLDRRRFLALAAIGLSFPGSLLSSQDSRLDLLLKDATNYYFRSYNHPLISVVDQLHWYAAGATTMSEEAIHKFLQRRVSVPDSGPVLSGNEGERIEAHPGQIGMLLHLLKQDGKLNQEVVLRSPLGQTYSLSDIAGAYAKMLETEHTPGKDTFLEQNCWAIANTAPLPRETSVFSSTLGGVADLLYDTLMEIEKPDPRSIEYLTHGAVSWTRYETANRTPETEEKIRSLHGHLSRVLETILPKPRIQLHFGGHLLESLARMHDMSHIDLDTAPLIDNFGIVLHAAESNLARLYFPTQYGTHALMGLAKVRQLLPDVAL